MRYRLVMSITRYMDCILVVERRLDDLTGSQCRCKLFWVRSSPTSKSCDGINAYKVMAFVIFQRNMQQHASLLVICSCMQSLVLNAILLGVINNREYRLTSASSIV